MKKAFLALLLLYSSALFAEEIVFDMSVFGFTFGKMVLTKTKENDSTELYTLVAKGKTNFLWMKREDETYYQVRYRNSKLLSSSYTQIESGVTKHWTKVVFDGKKYQVDSYRGKRSFTEVPVYSVITLYFKPDFNRSKVFYEAESEFIELKNIAENTIEQKSPDGSKTIYRFSNGKIKELEVHLSIATVHMQRIN